METVLVKPFRNRGEILFVVFSCALILATAAVLILLKNRAPEEQSLKPYQISAFSDIPTGAQGVFMDLYTGGFEIESYHRQNSETWPDIATLETNLFPPFDRNPVWESRGRIKWLMVPMGKDDVHRAVYIGKSGDSAATGSFIMTFEHFHTMDGAYFAGINRKTPFNIWYKTGDFILPKDFSEGSLIALGWREMIPYRGTDELKKLKRGN